MRPNINDCQYSVSLMHGALTGAQIIIPGSESYNKQFESFEANESAFIVSDKSQFY